MAERISGWLLTYFLHSTILLALVPGLARFTTSERTLERLWRIALLGPILSATIQNSTSSWLGALVSPPGTVGGIGLGARRILLAPQGGDGGTPLVGVGLAVWATVALVGLGLLLAGHVRLARLLRDRRLASDHPLGSRLSNQSLMLTQGIRTPIALISGEVCLPTLVVENLSREELEAIIAHEQEHVRRRDPLWLLVSSVICRTLFFQPLNWIAARRLRLLAEFVCDSSAARKTSPLAVASALASVAAGLGRHRLAAVGLAGSESLTVRRVRRILAGEMGSRPAGRMVPPFAAFLLGLSLFGPAVELANRGPMTRYVISAYDDGGPFTVTIERGRVLAVSLNGVPVPSADLRQEGNQVHVTPADGRTPLVLILTEGGGMQWTSRPRLASLN